MVASKFPGPAADSLPAHRSLQLIHGSLSGRAAGRRAPWLMGLHRAADGTLAGLGLSMLALSGLTLHWQNEWGQSFKALESSQVLEHRLQESAAQLERHHLKPAGKPGQLVPTSSDRLIFMPPPPAPPQASAALPLASLSWDPAASGY
ncbi:hypothetical protein KBY96_07325 [Cyanobium sp. ATX 6A2]|uniref:hypothetical protein n=1 Tax=Cyanobium sp. ATX 6A2 TaxID=2823700 RepID=UPI0020CF2650|nr:hypothetical protein [Cyanobium sp. ATX 6A2]MCP9887741.1 hypothetical protein [Cyanobium sp. ATX 6A2]